MDSRTLKVGQGPLYVGRTAAHPDQTLASSGTATGAAIASDTARGLAITADPEEDGASNRIRILARGRLLPPVGPRGGMTLYSPRPVGRADGAIRDEARSTRQTLVFGDRPFDPRCHGSEPWLPGRLALNPSCDVFAMSLCSFASFAVQTAMDAMDFTVSPGRGAGPVTSATGSTALRCAWCDPPAHRPRPPDRRTDRPARARGWTRRCPG